MARPGQDTSAVKVVLVGKHLAKDPTLPSGGSVFHHLASFNLALDVFHSKYSSTDLRCPGITPPLAWHRYKVKRLPKGLCPTTYTQNLGLCLSQHRWDQQKELSAHRENTSWGKTPPSSHQSKPPNQVHRVVVQLLGWNPFPIRLVRILALANTDPLGFHSEYSLLCLLMLEKEKQEPRKLKDGFRKINTLQQRTFANMLRLTRL